VSAILGIDAAWTATEPSGVALVRRGSGAWECIALTPSYHAFFELGDAASVDWAAVPSGAVPDVPRLLDVSRRLCKEPVDVVAVDMPLSRARIVGRRVADDQVSKAFGSRGCGTHSPSRKRPGRLAEYLRAGFEAQGYCLATTTMASGTSPALIEVYPHPAILCLCRAEYRVPYKASRARRYWPKPTSPVERRANLLAQWEDILAALREHISGILLDLPEAATSRLVALKRYEDALDALVCCWVGVEYLMGRAKAYGGAEAAIWTP
jgi:predicted RNase H-like nuclease